jgi:hypothetical protein
LKDILDENSKWLMNILSNTPDLNIQMMAILAYMLFKE